MIVFKKQKNINNKTNKGSEVVEQVTTSSSLTCNAHSRQDKLIANVTVGTDRNLNKRFRQEPPGQTFSRKLEGMVSDLFR